MPRRREVARRKHATDPKYNDRQVGYFTNVIMRGGKKSTAERIVYGSLKIIEDKTGQEGLAVMRHAFNNLRPNLEVKSRRVGGATYQVPVEIKPERRTALAMRWLIGFAKSRPDHTMAEKLASELIAASKNEGAAIKKREDTHRMAEANKAFAHYRW
jgi:small subunit ribosomal protein S7